MSTGPGAARLAGRYGAFRGLVAESTRRIRVGRGGGNDLVLAAPEVSKQHAELSLDESGRWRLTDLGSSNGTWVDGARVEESCELGEVAVVDFGGAGELIFQQVSANEVEGGALQDLFETSVPPDQTLVEQGPEFLADALGRLGVAADTSPDRTAVGEAAPALPDLLGGAPGALVASSSTAGDPEAAGLSESPSTSSSPERMSESSREEPQASPRGGAERSQDQGAPGEASWWLVFDQEEAPFEFQLARGSHTLGRGSTANLRVLHEHLSREHARIEVGDLVAVEDLGSSNHTFLEGRRVDGRTELEEGARLAFGDLRARLERRS